MFQHLVILLVDQTQESLVSFHLFGMRNYLMVIHCFYYNYHIRANKPFSANLPNCPKAPKSGLFEQKSAGLFEFSVSGGLIKSGSLMARI